MAEVVCYLILGPRIRKIALKNGSLHAMKEYVAKTESLHPLIGDINKAVYMIYDDIIKLYVDTEDDTVIPQNGKLWVHESKISLEYRMHQLKVTAPATNAAQNTMHVDNIPHVQVMKTMPLAYCLPQFPSHIQMQLVNRSLINLTTRRAIIECLYQSLISQGYIYPENMYWLVSSSLVTKYPHLRDVMGSGYDSWNIGLRTKFKNERRNMSGDVINAMRKKHSNNRKNGEPSLVTKRKESPNVHDEDLASINAHRVFLEKEAKKSKQSELFADL